MSSVDDFQHFMREFINGHLALPADEKLPPFRLVEDEVCKEEIKGHACGWTADYLNAHKCPVHWSNLVCTETIKRIADVDVNSYLISREDNDETTESITGSENCYDAAKLCQLTFSTVEGIITEWFTNFPTKWSDCCSKHRHKISHHAIKNTRRKMEDRHNIVPLLHLFTDKEEYKDSTLYAVFDGHGGPDASSYTAAQFLFNLVNQQTKDKSEALLSSFTQTDATFSVKATKEKLHCGSTGVAVLVDPDTLYVSWLGDSQALLVKSGRAVEIMRPHKPECEDERARIMALGGCVVWYGTWRVNGNLAVSRAIGDIDHKPFISSKAECQKITLDDEDEYVIVACDGLWDTVSFDKAVQLIYDHVHSGKSYASVAQTLVKEARNEGSGDNITVIVVFLKDNLSIPIPTEKPKEPKVEAWPVEEAEKDEDEDSEECEVD